MSTFLFYLSTKKFGSLPFFLPYANTHTQTRKSTFRPRAVREGPEGE